MLYLVCRFGRNVFFSILLLTIISITLFSSVAKSDEGVAEDVLTQCKKKYAIAKQNLKSRKYSEAKSLYQFIAQNSSDSILAFNGQAGLLHCEIALGNDSAVEKMLEKLEKDYPRKPEYCANLNSIANIYWQLKQYEKALDIFQYVAGNSLDDKLVFDAQLGVLDCEIALGNDIEVEEGIAEVMKGGVVCPELFKKVFQCGKYFQNIKKHDKAGELFQYIVQNDTKSWWAFESLNRLIHCEIRLDNYSAAEKWIPIFIKKHAQHPMFYKKIDFIAHLYEKKMKKPGKARDLYQYIYKNSSDRDLAFTIQQKIVGCEISLKDHAASEQAIKVLLKDFSTHPGIAEAMGQIGNRYLHEMRFARWENREEERKIYHELSMKFCKLFIKEYPNSSFAVTANSVIMKQTLIDNGNVDSVGDEFKNFLVDKSKDPRYFSYLEYILNIHANFKEKYKRYVINELKNKMANESALNDKKNVIEFLIKFSTPSNYQSALSEYTVFCASNGHCRPFLSTVDLLAETEGKHLIIRLYKLYLKTDQSAINRKLVTLRLYESKINEGTGGSGILELLEKYIVQNMSSNKDLAYKAVFLKGRAFVNSGDIEKARETFEVYKKQNPQGQNMPEVLYYIGYSHLIQGDFKQAKSSFRKILSDYPKSRYASKAKQYIKRINASVKN